MFSRFFSLDEQKTGVNEATGSKIRMIGYGAGLMLREDSFPKGMLHQEFGYFASECRFGLVMDDTLNSVTAKYGESA